MDMVKVDPKLFITCRLCLEQMGSYQITPVVREQFKFCFDIEVDPFDGLPQLICNDCQTVLSDYSTKKRIYIGSQNALRAQIQVRREVEPFINNVSQQQDKVSSSHQKDNNNLDDDQREYGKSKKVRQKSSASLDNDSRSNTPSLPKTVTRKKSFKHSESLFLKDNYCKKIICRFCNKKVKTKSSLRRHSIVHDDLKSKYADILYKTCTVNLVKLDGLPNTTGNPNTVMLDTSNIIGRENVKSVPHCVLYVPKKYNSTNGVENAGNESDSDNFTVNAVQRKRRRLLSTDTVVLGKDAEKHKSSDAEEKPTAAELECINIDDSSNASSNFNNTTDVTDIKAKDFTEIQNIVNMCRIRYIKKCESAEFLPVKIEPAVLKHKILSIGRKVINKGNMNCTGRLLRYMEYKNLEIKWTNKGANVVHIMPRLKLANDMDNLEHGGWKNLDELEQIHDYEPLYNSPPDSPKQIHIGSNSACLTKNETSNEPMKENNFPTGRDALHSTMDSDKKLLNASPVANPKQLPKKFFAVDSKSGTTVMWVQPEKTQDIGMDKMSDPDQQSDNNMPMPIITSTSSLVGLFSNDNSNQSNGEIRMPMITSTTSLAVTSAENEVNLDNNTNNMEDNEKSHPRIKVKPVSELMSDRALKSLTQQQVDAPANTWNQTILTVVPVNQGSMVMGNTTQTTPTIFPSNVTVVNVSNTPAVSNIPAQNDKSKVILDTSELPNTLTDSPIKYLKNLLQIHAITLLDTDKPVPPNFTCLVKFKLQVIMKTQIMLCLSLHCSENNFYLGVKHLNLLENIDINKLSASWQWEIIKSFTTQEKVVEKLLLNARRVSQDVYSNMERFLFVLKSIQYRSIT